MTLPVSATIDNSLVLNPFKSWLIAKSYSESTIRNYLSDLNAYFDFVENCKLKIENSNLFSPDTVSSYLKSIDKDSNANRYLSSLSKFFQFALDQNLIKIDPLKIARQVKKPSTNDVLSDYQSFLVKKHFSLVTIKNYLNDIRQFIDWCKTNQLAS